MIWFFSMSAVKREKDWAKKHAVIVDEIEDLGEGYSDALRDGHWRLGEEPEHCISIRIQETLAWLRTVQTTVDDNV